jgi:hypothetical protein
LRLWFPPFAKDMRNGAPPSEESACEIKIKVKGNGQECPFHAGRVKINFKSGAVGVRGSHPCARARKDGGTLRPFGKLWAGGGLYSVAASRLKFGDGVCGPSSPFMQIIAT